MYFVCECGASGLFNEFPLGDPTTNSGACRACGSHFWTEIENQSPNKFDITHISSQLRAKAEKAREKEFNV